MLKDNCESARFPIRFDLIDENHTFLAGSPSHISINMNLYFHFNNLPLVIYQTNQRLKHIDESSHQELLIICALTHQKPLYNFIPGDKRRTFNNSTPHHHKLVRITISLPRNICYIQRRKWTAFQNGSFLKDVSSFGVPLPLRWNHFCTTLENESPHSQNTINGTVHECFCTLATISGPRLVCSFYEAPFGNEKNASLDAVYFNEKPSLHCKYHRTGWLEIAMLRTHHLSDQIEILKWVHNRHGIPNITRDDQKFNKAAFVNFCNSQDIAFHPLAASHYEGNANMERATRSIHDYFILYFAAVPSWTQEINREFCFTCKISQERFPRSPKRFFILTLL